MKKIIILTGALCVLASYSANAQVSVTFGEYPAYPVYAQPVYEVPPYYAPGYVEYYHRYPSVYYDHRGHHGHGDMAYWAQRHRDGDRDADDRRARR